MESLSGAKIKVVQITHDLSLGGLQRVITHICKEIDRSVFDIRVLCLRGKGMYSSEIENIGIPVDVVPQKEKGTDYLTILKIASYLKKEKPDVVHTHNTQPFIEGAVAAKLVGIKRIIHTDHARRYPDKKRYMFAEYLVSHMVYKVVGVSEHTSRDLIKYEHILPSKITTIYNGINTASFNVKIDKVQKKREIGIPLDGPVIGVVSRINEQKGISYLLKAMPEVVKKNPKVLLVLAGDGPQYSSFINEVKSMGLCRNVFL